MVRRIGLFGGTFDPVHNGHLAAARATIEQLELESVIFIPAAKNPLKRHPTIAGANARMEMIARAIEGEDQMGISDIEIERGAPSYAFETLQDFKVAQPAEYWWLLGSDALAEFTKWHKSERIIELCRLAAFPRSTYDLRRVSEALPRAYRLALDAIEMRPVNVSSSDIRGEISRGEDVTHRMPQSVWNYIRESECYSDKAKV